MAQSGTTNENVEDDTFENTHNFTLGDVKRAEPTSVGIADTGVLPIALGNCKVCDRSRKLRHCFITDTPGKRSAAALV
jgi:hypothetical protein